MNVDLSVFSYDNYVAFLADTLSSKRAENLEYSQANFAEELLMSPPRMSQVLKGKEGISIKRASAIVELFEFSQKEREYFLHLISSKTSRSKIQKEISQQFIRDNHKIRVPHYLSMDKWCLLDLEGWDIVWNLIEVNSDFSDLNKIGEICKITPAEVEKIMKTMESLELILRKNGEIIKLKKHISFGNSVPNSTIRNHHKRKIIQSLRALEVQGQDKRKNESMTFTVGKDDFKRLSLKIETFMDNFLNDIEQSEHDEVLSLNISMFSCT
jgi:uncharacterized protein (TIGR02147 family)